MAASGQRPMRNVAFDALQAGGAKKTCRRLLSVDSSTLARSTVVDLRARGSETHRRDVTALRREAKRWRFALCQSASQKVKALRSDSDRSAARQSAYQDRLTVHRIIRFQGRTNRRNTGKTSVDRSTKATLTLTIPGCN